MFDKLYYCTNIKLAENSVIEKGSNPIDEEKGVPFGYGEFSHRAAIIELFLEIARLETFPKKPKRTNSIFTCKDLNSFSKFIQFFRSRTGVYCYEVQPTKDTYNYHVGDYMYHGLLEHIKEEGSWELMRYKDFNNYAVLYWGKAPPEDTTEIVIESPVKIIKEIDLNLD